MGVALRYECDVHDRWGRSVHGDQDGTSENARAGFGVSDLTHPTFTYTAGGNHDPDGDSNGAAITFTRR
jgi:hypothetical protein